MGVAEGLPWGSYVFVVVERQIAAEVGHTAVDTAPGREDGVLYTEDYGGWVVSRLSQETNIGVAVGADSGDIRSSWDDSGWRFLASQPGTSALPHPNSRRLRMRRWL